MTHLEKGKPQAKPTSDYAEETSTRGGIGTATASFLRLAALFFAVASLFIAALSPSSTSADEGIKAPFKAGLAARVTQGANNPNSYSHTGSMLHAVDFGVPEGTPVVAVVRGTITHVLGSNSPNAYGDKSFIDKANYVVLKGADGTAFLYLHLSRVDVKVGQAVEQGQQLGLSGRTGWTNGEPHLHLQRQWASSSYFGNSIAIRFDEFPGRELVTGNVLVSQNRGTQPVLTAPARPENLSASATGTSSVRLRWEDRSNNEDGFGVWRWDGSKWVLIRTLPANSTSFDDSGLRASTWYYYYVGSYNRAGTSFSSSYVSVRTNDAASITLNARFVGEGAPYDGTVVARGALFNKRWTLQNTSSVDWSAASFRARKISGAFGPDVIGLKGNVPRYANTDIESTFRAPTTPGKYRVTYRMEGPNGQQFGPTFWLEVQVR